MPECPKCGSSNISAQKKGFSVKKALVGRLLFGKVGLLAGAVDSDKIRLICLDCGYEFKPGDNKPDLESSIMSHYTPVCGNDISPAPKRKETVEQTVRIETLLKYRDVIKESKVSLLEALLTEGHTHVIVPAGEIDILAGLQRQGSAVRRIVSFKECK